MAYNWNSKQKNISMKKSFFKPVALAAMVLLTLGACNNPDHDRNGNNDAATADHDQADVAEDHNDAKFDKAAEKDAQFAVDAAMINLREIEASNLAVSRASRAEVKTLAQTMVDDHRKAYEELQGLASKKNITIPAALSDDEAKDATKLRDEKKFDKKYTDLMVDEHKKAIDKFEKAAQDCQDADLRDWANKMLPGLRHHLDMAMALNDKIKEQ